MKTELTLISTGIGVVEKIVSLVRQERPDMRVHNIIDDSVIPSIVANNNVVPPGVIRRLSAYCHLAEEGGAEAILVTCSSISEIVDIARHLVGVPIFKIDEPMAEIAASRSRRRIGIAATLNTTLDPTERLIRSKVSALGKHIEIQSDLCGGAFQALWKGDSRTHDEIVIKVVRALLSDCDIVVLAQASMARAAERLKREEQERVLTSPASGVKRVLEYMST